jgi:hypothetical protein
MQSAFIIVRGCSYVKLLKKSTTHAMISTYVIYHDLEIISFNRHCRPMSILVPFHGSVIMLVEPP